MVFDDLSINIGGESADGKAAIRSVKRSLESTDRAADDLGRSLADTGEDADELASDSVALAATLQALKNRADAAEGQLNQAGNAASTTSVRFGALIVSTGSLTTALLGLGAATGVTTAAVGALLTTLAPLAVVLGGIIAAAGSLAAVFGGLAAAGAVTHMSELKEAFAEAKEEIIEIIEPLGEVFGPLLVDAVEALPDLVEGIVDSLGPLDQFRDSLERLGEFALEVIPRITGFMFDLAEAALPALNRGLGWLDDNSGTVSRTLSRLGDVFWRVFPLVVDLGREVVDLLGPVLRLGTAVASVLLPALTQLIDWLGEGIRVINSLIARFGAPLQTRLQSVRVAIADVATAVRSQLLAILPQLRQRVTGALGEASQTWQAHEDDVRQVAKSIRQFVRRYVSRAAEVVRLLAAGEFRAAFARLYQTVRSAMVNIRRALVGSGQSGLLIESIRDIGSFLRTNGAALLDDAFDAIATAIENRLTTLRIFAVGQSGNGGIINTLVRQAGGFLRSSGKSILRSAFDAAFETGQAVLENLRIALIGAGGSGGLVNTIIGQIASFLSAESGGKGMIRLAFKTIGRVVRAVFQDLYRGLILGENSITKSIIDSITSYIRNDAWSDMKRAFGILVDVIMAAFEGLYQGLIGGSLIPKMFREIEQFVLKWGTSKMKIAFNGVKNAIKGALAYVWSTGENSLYSDVTSTITDLANTIVNKVGNAVESALQQIRSLPNKIDIPVDVGSDGRGSAGGGGDVGSGAGGGGGGFAGGDWWTRIQTGGFVGGSGLALVHEGEQVVPPAQVTNRGTVEASIDADALAEGFSRALQRADIGDARKPDEIVVRLENADRYRQVQR